MQKGCIFNIQKFCVSDGPGIRTTVFFKGCPLRCLWCHNPEGLSCKQNLYYRKDKCINCGHCVSVCPKLCHKTADGQHDFDRTSCDICGLCAKSCLTGALEIAGTEMSVEEVMEEVIKDAPFYKNSGGGITLSGGEPLLQPEFALALLQASKAAGIHTCMETSGFAKKEVFEMISGSVDLFLFDFKETNEKLHKEYTGVSNRIILENLRFLDNQNRFVILRCPIIPGLNDCDEHYEGIGTLAESLKNIVRIELEPYHPLGLSKREQLGLPPAFINPDFLSKTVLEKAAQQIKQYTSKEIYLES